MPERHFIIVLNEEAGTVVRLGRKQVIETVTQAFRESEVRITLHAVPGREVERHLKDAAASEADAVIVGGGDGTVASAATLLAGRNKTMGVLPLGTFNLAARDLGMPLDLEEAGKALVTAPVVPMDAMELNGKLYLCLMVLGFYPALKMAAPEYHGWWIFRALRTLRDSLRQAATFPSLGLTLVHEGKAIECRTRAVIIANNDYEDVFGVLPKRESLDGGFFTVHLSTHRSRYGMMKSFFAWLFGRWKEDREVKRLRTTELEIHARKKRHLPVMMDGEVDRLPLPLKITLKPKALNVLAPRKAEEKEKE
ncbi:diacylglycerol/lipid kinase family protein [Brevifollis gellanilyticus]|uniref:Diacylglycerol kinase n=1 Tax=Brevifollis gellanilyticus TaxID=748831 RepID=A0A512M5I1_9BACT|nr:diacylglycerol kinase family protein [Brevifollis gellanilyticus]GEP41988.1 diacylglycerol kinase [Brevifollis gellanilyticus]